MPDKSNPTCFPAFGVLKLRAGRFESAWHVLNKKPVPLIETGFHFVLNNPIIEWINSRP